MTAIKLLRRITIILLIPLVLLLGGLVLVSLLGITVNLDSIRPLVEQKQKQQ